MENFFSRYKNPLVLMLVLFIQVVALATQVKRPDSAKASSPGGGPRLIRVWTVTAFTPVERMFVSTGHFFRDGWHNYLYLRGIRKENRDLHEKIAQLQMQQVRLKQDADQARRLQGLLEFREKFIARTVPAQVIATSGMEQSRLITIDKGYRDGIKPDMAVITPDGIVGKVKEVFSMSSQVLLINDRDSDSGGTAPGAGAGVILETSRLQGILKGNSQGELEVSDVMSDEKVEPGEHVITSGGDRIYPKGLPVGTVIFASPDRDNDPFLAIKIKPAADLNRLEEVLVITKTAEEPQSFAGETTPMRAADILAQRLPSISRPDPNAAKPGAPATATPSPAPDKHPAAGPGSQVRAVGTGAATPTPTPRPKTVLKKPVLPGSTPGAPASASPETRPKDAPPGTAAPSATPVPDGEKPPR